jgi:signal transduction histidine kinase
MGHDDHLQAEVRQDLLRIAQEAISDAVRHAKSTTISVSLSAGPQKMTLEVADDGSGLELAPESSQGFGLANMRARARRLGGSLRIRTRPGRGTSILVTIPAKVSLADT